MDFLGQIALSKDRSFNNKRFPAVLLHLDVSIFFRHFRLRGYLEAKLSFAKSGQIVVLSWKKRRFPCHVGDN